MKLSKEALLEIVSIIQGALLSGRDASQGLRDLDFNFKNEELVLTTDYITSHPREDISWEEDGEEHPVIGV